MLVQWCFHSFVFPQNSETPIEHHSMIETSYWQPTINISTNNRKFLSFRIQSWNPVDNLWINPAKIWLSQKIMRWPWLWIWNNRKVIICSKDNYPVTFVLMCSKLNDTLIDWLIQSVFQIMFEGNFIVRTHAGSFQDPGINHPMLLIIFWLSARYRGFILSIALVDFINKCLH
jgi:hypothetical protein